MSIRSWKKEFYPITARKTLKRNALKHSIQKWKGLLPKNLAKHDLKAPPIEITADTCALCHHSQDGCADCQLFKIRGRVSCCNEIFGDEKLAPHEIWITTADPHPMLAWMLLAKELK
jgi:hypothetical protein